MESFQPLSLQGLTPEAQLQALRVNCLGSLYLFIKVGLRRHRLTEHLHGPICKSLERQHIKDLYELPRDHFKTTICTEGLPMWWALPFTRQDEDIFGKLGYADEFLNWMKWCHDPSLTTLLVSENITNAAKLGKRISRHLKSNTLYRGLFPETLPTSAQTWTNYSVHLNRTGFGSGDSDGEGNFDFIGANGALQSRHYSRGIIQDDLVGRKAAESAAVMEDTIQGHQLVVGAFSDEDKTHEGNELVIGNRWGFHDLNSYIREHEPWFRVSSHGALGGCCDAHPLDTPIFPEEFSKAKLARIKSRLGSYLFSCQFLNNPISPEDADFQESWLNYFTLDYVDVKENDRDYRRLVAQHEVKDGVVRKDLRVGHMSICMVVDPNHSGNAAGGRSRHAITVIGNYGTQTYYLLDVYAAHASYDTFYNKVFEMAQKWKLHRIGVETVAAQKYVKHHIEYLRGIKGWELSIQELKGEVEAPDGTLSKKKEWRIRNILSPIFEEGRFFVQRCHQDFLGEYGTFPRGKFADILDTLAYAPGVLRHALSYQENLGFLLQNQKRAQQVGVPYSHVARVQ